jgi:hypothetical protein
MQISLSIASLTEIVKLTEGFKVSYLLLVKQDGMVN